jgi:hypothetical protein
MTPATEDEYASAMMALTRSEGHAPRRGPWPGTKNLNERPLPEWMIEVLRRSKNPSGFLVTVKNCRDAGARMNHLNQVLSPLVTRKLVRVGEAPGRRRRFFISDTGKQYLRSMGG